MKVIDFKELVYTDFSVKEVVAINKFVENNQTFSVTDERETSVLVHLKNCHIKYVAEDGSELFVKKGSVVFIPHTAKYQVTYIADSENLAFAQLVAFELWNERGEKFIPMDGIGKLCGEHGNIYKTRFDELVEISSSNQFDFCRFKAVLYSVLGDISQDASNTKSEKTACLLTPYLFLKTF